MSETDTVRDYNDIPRDELVRDYRTLPGDRLYAYREGAHHVVVSRGDEPRDRWTKHLPAERERAVPGQKLWTIPDNWDLRIKSKRDDIDYGIFYVPETDMWVKASIPTNNWLVDAWYGIKAVGSLDLSLEGDLAQAADVFDLAGDIEEEGHEDLAEAVLEVARNWIHVCDGYVHDLEWLRDNGPWWDIGHNEWVSVDANWGYEAQEYLYQPKMAIEEGAIEFPDGVAVEDVIRELRQEGLLSNPYRATLSIDDSDVGMDYHVRALVEAGCSASEALDYYMVEIEGMTQTAWAEERGVDQSSVSGNVSDAKDVVGK